MTKFEKACQIVDVTEPEFVVSALGWLMEKHYVVEFVLSDTSEGRVWMANVYKMPENDTFLRATIRSGLHDEPPVVHLLADLVTQVAHEEIQPHG